MAGDGRALVVVGRPVDGTALVGEVDVLDESALNLNPINNPPAIIIRDTAI